MPSSSPAGATGRLEQTLCAFLNQVRHRRSRRGPQSPRSFLQTSCSSFGAQNFALTRRFGNAVKRWAGRCGSWTSNDVAGGTGESGETESYVWPRARTSPSPPFARRPDAGSRVNSSPDLTLPPHKTPPRRRRRRRRASRLPSYHLPCIVFDC